MSEIKKGMQYESRKHAGLIGTVLKNDDERMTVILDLSDGTNTCITYGTLKRWWKKVANKDADPETLTDEEHVKQVMEQKKELGIECPPIDHADVVSENEAVKYVKAGQALTAELNKNNSKTLQQMVDDQAAPKKKAKNPNKEAEKQKYMTDLKAIEQLMQSTFPANSYVIKKYQSSPRDLFIKGNTRFIADVHLGTDRCMIRTNVTVPGIKYIVRKVMSYKQFTEVPYTDNYVENIVNVVRKLADF